jgi:putative hydrolase of the HAD superfamily
MSYTHIFFDLDRTLWDFDRNSLETFADIHLKYDLQGRGVSSFDEFMRTYQKINLELWDYYRKGEIRKEVLNVKRFSLTLDTFGITDGYLSESIAQDYVSISPTKNHLYPGTIEILEYLVLEYKLYIITNGFEEVQHSKLKNSNLERFFTHVITSEDAGCKKPDVNIFKYALAVAGAKPDTSLMVGDDIEVDIDGARSAQIDQVLVDYEKIFAKSAATFYVNSLYELKNIL